MEEKWLTKKRTIAELDNSFRSGYLSAEWEALKAKMIDDDELWEFSSPKEDWDSLAGREGIALVRNGQVIASIVTFMS